MEEIEAQPEEEVLTQPKTSFFDKIKTHKFKILGGFLGILVFSGAILGAYRLGERQVRPGPRPTPTPGLVATPASTLKELTSIVGKILASPQDYLGEEVEIVGYYRGWDLLDETGTHPPVTKSDWAIKDSSGAIYIEAGVPIPAIRNLEPWSTEDTSKIVSIKGVVKISSEGIPYIHPLAENCIKTKTGESMTLEEAWEIALASECIEEGGLLDKYSCNEYTGTWWIDLNLKKPGCAPACIVDISAKKAEINWRCTGFGPLK